MATALGFGCSHYQRKCKLVAPCCKKIYTCRVCHDDAEAHVLNRRSVQELVCMICHQRQRVRRSCIKCEAKFGEYFCPDCKLFDDQLKGQFHCDQCGLCRVGGAGNYFHCDVCNMCLNVQLWGAHKCVENRSHTDCPVCMEDLHSSRNELHIPGCGHLLHKTCFDELKSAAHLDCPLCKKPFDNN